MKIIFKKHNKNHFAEVERIEKITKEEYLKIIKQFAAKEAYSFNNGYIWALKMLAREIQFEILKNKRITATKIVDIIHANHRKAVEENTRLKKETEDYLTFYGYNHD